MTNPSVEVRRAVRECLADLPPEALVLVACSGGPDSIALAAASKSERSRVGAVIVDHGLRPESAAEAQRALDIDGGGAGRLLKRVAELLEDPVQL